MKLLLILVTIIFSAQFALSASFDCDKASSAIEKKICNNSELSSLDSSLGRSYSDLTKNFTKKYAPKQYSEMNEKLQNEQRFWLKNVRNQCETETCLKNIYLYRINELASVWLSLESFTFLPEGRKREKYVLVQKDPNSRLTSFNKSGGFNNNNKILSCATLVDLPVGTAYGNHSYGGICYLKENKEILPVMVCDDEMVGHFSLEKIQKENTSVYDLADFVRKNCYGG